MRKQANNPAPEEEAECSNRLTRSGKRKNEEDERTQAGNKRAKSEPQPELESESEPEAEPEYVREKRNMEDLWQAAFSVGTEWHNMDKLYETKWDFSNLEEAFEEGGLLYEKKVYLFGSTEPARFPDHHGNVNLIPIVVAVETPIPPSDKIGLASVQRETEDIIPMKQMKMAWVPYVPLENRQRQLEGFKPQIFTMACTQRRSALKHLKEDRVKQFDYCIPYYDFKPLMEEKEESTVVDILYPIKPPLPLCDYDWNNPDYEIEELANDLIEWEQLPEDHKEEFMKFVQEEVDARKAAIKEAREARRKTLEDLDTEKKLAFQNMKFYKFYPVGVPASGKVNHINRYYPKAHMVLSNHLSKKYSQKLKEKEKIKEKWSCSNYEKKRMCNLWRTQSLKKKLLGIERRELSMIIYFYFLMLKIG